MKTCDSFFLSEESSPDFLRKKALRAKDAQSLCRKLFGNDRQDVSKSAFSVCYALGDLNALDKSYGLAATGNWTKYNLIKFQ